MDLNNLTSPVVVNNDFDYRDAIQLATSMPSNAVVLNFTNIHYTGLPDDTSIKAVIELTVANSHLADPGHIIKTGLMNLASIYGYDSIYTIVTNLLNLINSIPNKNKYKTVCGWFRNVPLTALILATPE
jgi:hypothetical protein